MARKKEQAGSVKDLVDKLQRLALQAAVAGILASVTLVILLLAMQRFAPASARLQASFEAVCLFLWPSAILLLGAQTSGVEQHCFCCLRF